jgi:hypothetical protein
MANIRLTMRKIREVLRLHFECDRTHREIAQAIGTSTSISLGDVAGRPLRDTKLSLVDAPSRSQLIRLAKRINGCFRLICSRSGWRKKSPSVTGVFRPIRTSSKNAGFSR